MSASTYIGRIGVLAASLGVGMAVFTAPATAWADSTESDNPGSSAPQSPAAAQSAGDKDSSTPRQHVRRGSQAAGSASASKPRRGTADITLPDLAPAAAVADAPKRGSDSPAAPAQQQADSVPAPAASTPVKPANSTPAVTKVAADPVVDVPTPAAAAAVVAPAAALTVSPVTPQPLLAPTALVRTPAVTQAGNLPTAIATVANKLSTAITSVVNRLASTFSGTPFAPQIDSPINWLMLAAARRTQLFPAAATATANATTTSAPTLITLNGYNVVPTSTQVVRAFTGRWSYFPGLPNMLQGAQSFSLVDPNTKEALGAFDALVTSGDPTSIGARYVQMLVTANDGVNVGTAAGQTPPVGSLISQFSWGPLFGLSYSAMPTPSGDKVSVKLKTLFGEIPLPLTYDAAKGIVDHTFDNRPVGLGNGYSLAPTKPLDEKVTATIGLLPAFNSIQGNQQFGVYNTDGEQVGTFHGEFTTTSDVLGIYTQAILVTANDGINVGTGAGQTPPVGSVYNVAYFGGDENYLIYSSLPEEKGPAAISVKWVSPKTGVIDLESYPLLKALIPQLSFDASNEPVVKPMAAPGGQKFIPTSAVIPSGINGLPPRDAQFQGYQQYDVYGFFGNKLGSVDAQIENQWDAIGAHGRAILITNVREGTPGSTPLNVPPVGTVLNFIYLDYGFGFSDAVIPQPLGDLNAFQFVTPFGNIPLLPLPLPVFDRQPVDYVNPFLI